jgi:CubicO group peptidase (beta-lactamase class C family)
MKTNFKISVTILFLMLLTTFQSGAQTKKYTADIEEKIRQVENNLAGWVKTGSNDTWNLADRMKKYNINGVSIAVIHNYKIEWARGYGFANVSENRQVTETTLFQAASISKSLNGVGVLKLVQEKKLDLNTDINKYLVTWKFPYDEKSNNKKITIANLLSHTAGLTIHGFPGYARGEALPLLSQILDGQKPANTEPVRSNDEPGKSVNYSGGGVTISQMIVMDVTKQPYDLYMKENVLDPLGMTSSSYTQPPSADNEKILATGYRADGTEIPGKYHIYPEQAAAGLWTNPVDLSKYIIETQLSYKGESSLVLTPEMTKLRLTPVMEDAALGTFVNSRVTGSFKYFNHNGGNEGFQCTAIGCRDSGEGVVIMTNSDNGSRIYEEIANSVASVYNWKDYYLPEIKKVIEVNGPVLDKYVGKYDAEGTTVTITKSENGLLVNVYGDVIWKVYFTSDSDFFIREFRGSLKFKTGSDNKVAGISLNGKLAKKIE